MTPRVAVLMPTIGERPQQVSEFFQSMNKYYPDTPVYGCVQDGPVPGNWAGVIDLPELIGPHQARLTAFRQFRDHADVWIVVDDELIVTHKTRWQPAVQKAQQPGVGIVSCNWARSTKQIRNRDTPDTYLKQIIVYTGGGMAISTQVLNEIEEDTGHLTRPVCDNTTWSMSTYLNGRTNYRYRGSLAINQASTVGGLRTYLKQAETEWHLQPFIDRRPTKHHTYDHPEANYCIPQDQDVNQKAKRLHQQTRRTRFQHSDTGTR